MGVGALILFEQQFFLIQRGKAPEFGRWSVPGGRVRFGESLRQAVTREIREETQIDCQVDQICFQWEYIQQDFHYVILDYLCQAKHPQFVIGSDAQQGQWFSLKQALELPLAQGIKELLQAVILQGFIEDNE